MGTIFTSSSLRTLFATFIFAFFSLNLAGQTTHQVAVTDFAFTPSQLTITAGDKVVWTNTGAMGHNVNGMKATFASNPESFGNSVGLNWTYEFVFNTAGTYDYHCDPHLTGMKGKVIVSPKSAEPLKLTVNFTAMNPHIGQTLWLAVIDKATMMEIGRIKTTAAQAFSIEVPGIEVGKSYWVNFFADHNKNGVYNLPPADHTWQRSLDNVTGNSVIDFAHNTTFTDIAWKTKLTLRFTSMTPHVGQKLTLFVRDNMGIDLDNVVVPSVAGPNFDVLSWVIKPGMSYNLDFYADHNKNGVYNAPPADHAWRLPLTNVKSDTIVSFVHNTFFTDIFLPTKVENLTGNLDNIRLYPNPASNYIELKLPVNYEKVSSLKVYSIAGTLIHQKVFSGNAEYLRYDLSNFRSGIYFMEINAGSKRDILKFMKQ
ncbi:MAG: plastocyanin/azurin family copper-binding protein [Bacteroidota bacterium]|nr:plastocyanin/azurin family copper-binding protein [Bacteroidota bacterium]